MKSCAPGAIFFSTRSLFFGTERPVERAARRARRDPRSLRTAAGRRCWCTSRAPRARTPPPALAPRSRRPCLPTRASRCSPRARRASSARKVTSVSTARPRSPPLYRSVYAVTTSCARPASRAEHHARRLGRAGLAEDARLAVGQMDDGVGGRGSAGHRRRSRRPRALFRATCGARSRPAPRRRAASRRCARRSPRDRDRPGATARADAARPTPTPVAESPSSSSFFVLTRNFFPAESISSSCWRWP